MPISTKPGSVVMYHKDLPSIMSEDPFIAWSCKVT